MLQATPRDEYVCFPIAQGPVEQPVLRPARRRSTRQMDTKLNDVVKVSAVLINVILEPVYITVPTGLTSAKKRTNDAPPLVRQTTSDDDLTADEEVVAASKFP